MQSLSIIWIECLLPESHWPNKSRITDRVGEADALMVATVSHEADAQEQASNTLQKKFELLGTGISSAYTFGSMRAQTEVIFDAIVALLVVMSVLMALVGGLGLMGAMSINVMERTREIGVLRAIGAHNKGVTRIFVLEGLVIGLLSWILGSFLAIPIGLGLGQAIGLAIMGVPLTFSYSFIGLGLWLVIVVVLSSLASYIPARRAAHLTVREVLGYE